MPIFEVSNVKI